MLHFPSTFTLFCSFQLYFTLLPLLFQVITGDAAAYRMNLQDVVPGHSGPSGCRQSAILLSKAARRLFFHHHSEMDRNTQVIPTIFSMKSIIFSVKAIVLGLSQTESGLF